MPYSMEDFAAQIKAKFPEYASWPTDHLVTEVVAKHPEYASWVTLDPRTAIAVRKQNPPATAHGDPNAGTNDIGAGDIAASVAKGIAHLAGVPTSGAEIPQAVKDWALNVATMGTYGATKTAVNAVGDVAHGRVPIVGRAVSDVAQPAIAVAHGNAPSRDQNLKAIESGTSLAGAAAMASPGFSEAIASRLPGVGAGIAESGTKSYADALAPEGSPNRPLAESLGSQLAGEGKVMTNPKRQLGTAFGGSPDAEAIPVKKVFPEYQDAQLKTLQKKFPDATITEDGQGNFVVNKPGERSLNQQGADTLAEGITPEAKNWWAQVVSKGAAGAVGGKVGFMLGGPAGAAAGIGVAEAPLVIREMVQSPLWKTTSGVVKASLGKAMQAGDMAEVTNIAAKVLGGVNLEDSYGHDQALFALMQSAQDPKALHNYAAAYVNPDGSHIEVPYHVQKSTFDALATAPSSAPPMNESARRTGSAVEFPKTGNRDENDAMLMRRDGRQFPVPVPPSQLLPQQFQNARAVTYGSPLSGQLDSPEERGLYGRRFEKSDTPQTSPDNTVLIAKSATDEPGTYAHEVNHAVYQKDLTADQRRQFQTVVVNAVNAGARDPSAISTIPKAVIAYANANPNDHDRAFNEIFAELGAQYMLNPTAFKSAYPSWYGMMKSFYGGREYVGGRAIDGQ